MEWLTFWKTCKQTVIAVLFIIIQNWTQSRCPLLGERTNKMLHMLTIEYYSAMRVTKYWCMVLHWWIWTTSHWVKEARLWRPHIVCSTNMQRSEKRNSQQQRIRQFGATRWGETDCKWAQENILGWWKCSKPGLWWWWHNSIHLLKSMDCIFSMTKRYDM